MTEAKMQLEDWLDDLCVRFIINLPEEDLSSVARICFQVEEAQWFYEDFIRPLDPSLPSMSLRSFCLRIFQHCPLLSVFSADNHMRAFEEFLLYKTRVPVRGAIMLNKEMDSVVLVKGWKKGANWSFPRGKINKDEDDLDCAIREVYEETGYDIREAQLVPADRDVKYIEITMREQHMRLYVFRDVPMETHFEPRTRKEISKIQWYRLSELPAFRKKGQPQTQDGVEAAVNANKFYMVAPFLVPLKKWVVEQKKRDIQRALSNQHLATAFIDDLMTEEESGVERRQHGRGIQADESRTLSAPGLDTMEGATAALHRLLKIQPPTQGLQPEAATAVQSPGSKSSGEALLALLQGKPKDLNQTSQHASISHTHLIPIYPDVSISNTAQNQFGVQPHSNISAIASHPFPLHAHDRSYVQQTQQQQDPQLPEKDMQLPNQVQGQHYSQQPQGPLRQVYQPQQLQHPQPLPPQVQRAVFTGDQVHGPMLPQPRNPQPMIKHAESVSIALSEPQFPNIHGPLISPILTQNQPKLTSHSLALLNAFKGPQQPGVLSSVTSAPMQELSADGIQHDRSIPNKEPVQDASKTYMAEGPLFPTKAAVSDDHRKSLLSMFKSSNSQSSNVDPAATITTPADIQQASEANSARQPLVDPALNIHFKPSKVDMTPRMQPQSHPQPPVSNPSSFRPTRILARPPQGQLESAPVSNSLTSHHDNVLKSYLNIAGSPATEVGENQGVSEQSVETTRAPNPQILKRPQHAQPMPVELAASPTFPPSFFIQHSVDRRVNQPSEQKQALLSLFRTSSTGASDLMLNQQPSSQPPERVFDIAPDITIRSRIDSLASAAGNMGSESSSRRSSHAPISAADKGILLGYLDAIARGSDK